MNKTKVLKLRKPDAFEALVIIVAAAEFGRVSAAPQAVELLDANGEIVQRIDDHIPWDVRLTRKGIWLLDQPQKITIDTAPMALMND